MSNTAQDALTFHIEGKAYRFDELTLGEIEFLEEELGAGVGEIDFRSAKAIIRVVYLLKRREDPEYTLDRARGVQLTALEGEPEPVKGAKPRPTKRSA